MMQQRAREKGGCWRLKQQGGTCEERDVRRAEHAQARASKPWRWRVYTRACWHVQCSLILRRQGT